MVIWVVLVWVAVLLAYVRLAPSDPVKWNAMPPVVADKTFKKGVIRVVPAGSDGLARLTEIALATPRTTALAGSVDDGMITFVTRTAVMGFPDYTSVRQSGDDLEIYARSRFGRSDLGVNKVRVQNWINALQP